MSSARKIKLTFLSRRFVSKRQKDWGPYVSGLRYGDVRSHQRRPHVASGNGITELNSVPFDEMHGYRKEWKKEDKKDRRLHDRRKAKRLNLKQKEQ